MRRRDMTKSILVERLFGGKSYYDVDVIEEKDGGDTLIINHFLNKKELKFDPSKKCFVVKREF
jgi:hypothetical protein